MKVAQRQLSQPAAQKKITFSEAVNSEKTQALIMNSLKDPQRAANFASTLISIVASDDKLKDCNPDSIVAAALRGEGMGLLLALGQYSIVAYKDTAAYQTGYKGFAQLAVNSGMYADIDVFDVREGEYKGRDPKKRQPIFEWISDEKQRRTLPVAGVYAYFELKSGFFKSIYWTYDEILDHADTYAPAFKRELYDALLSGKLDKEDPDKARRLRSGSPWYAPPLSEAHLKMCKKTVLLQLLNSGFAPLSIQMRDVIANELSQEKGGNVINPNDPSVIKANAPVEKEVIDSTATVTDIEQNAAEPARMTQESVQPTKRRVSTPEQ